MCVHKVSKLNYLHVMLWMGNPHYLFIINRMCLTISGCNLSYKLCMLGCVHGTNIQGEVDRFNTKSSFVNLQILPNANQK